MRLLFLLLVVFGTSLDCPTPPEGIIQKIYEPDSKCIYIWEENLPWLVAEKECEKIKSLDFNEIIFKKGSQISLIITFGTKENSLFHKIKKFWCLANFLYPKTVEIDRFIFKIILEFKNSDKTHLAELVTIHDQLFNDWLLETLTREFDESYYYRSYWIGLRKVDFDHRIKPSPWMIRMLKFILILGLCAKRASLNGSMVLHLSMRIGKEKFNLL